MPAARGGHAEDARSIAVRRDEDTYPCGTGVAGWARIYDRGGDLLLLAGGGASGGDLVLVRESAEDSFPPDPVLGEVDRFGRTSVSLSRG
jgi:hypothetical protein